MNMEIALILAHIMILAPNFYTGNIEEPIPMVIELKIKHSKSRTKNLDFRDGYTRDLTIKLISGVFFSKS